MCAAGSISQYLPEKGRMYLTFMIVAGIGVLLSALSAITALVRSIAERRNQGMQKKAGFRTRR